MLFYIGQTIFEIQIISSHNHCLFLYFFINKLFFSLFKSLLFQTIVFLTVNQLFCKCLERTRDFSTITGLVIFNSRGYLSNFATGSLKFPLSEIRKASVRLVVPFAKNTTHPHPHHPPNDEIRLINTSVPKIKSWNCSITFFSSQTFCWDVMEIVITK